MAYAGTPVRTAGRREALSSGRKWPYQCGQSREISYDAERGVEHAGMQTAYGSSWL